MPAYKCLRCGRSFTDRRERANAVCPWCWFAPKAGRKIARVKAADGY